jgi:hypothetical protein
MLKLLIDVNRIGAEHNQRQIGTGAPDCLDGIGPETIWRIEVHNDDVRSQSRKLFNGLARALGLAHDLHIPLAPHGQPQPDTHYRVVVGNHHSDLGGTVIIHGGLDANSGCYDFGLNFQLPRGIKPGMPVFATELSLCRVSM